MRTMIDLIIDELNAKPFEPFALTLVTNQRCQIRTREHISLLPPDEADRRPPFVVVYNAQTSLPRYIALESIISIDHES